LSLPVVLELKTHLEMGLVHAPAAFRGKRDVEGVPIVDDVDTPCVSLARQQIE